MTYNLKDRKIIVTFMKLYNDAKFPANIILVCVNTSEYNLIPAKYSGKLYRNENEVNIIHKYFIKLQDFQFMFI